MEIKTKAINKVSIISLSGRFDAFEAPDVQAAIEKEIRLEPGKIVINLKGVNFIDSTGLAILVKAMKNCAENSIPLALAELQDSVRVILEITRLDRAFQIYSTEEEAVETEFGN